MKKSSNKNNKMYKGIIIAGLIFVIILITLCIILLQNQDQITEDGYIDLSKIKVTQDNSGPNNKVKDQDITYNPNKSYSNVREVFTDFNTYIVDDYKDSNYNLRLNARFPKDLYNEDGSSNQEYFEEMIKRVVNYIEEREFVIYDSNKEISISVVRDDSKKEVTYKINDLSNYYGNFNYQKYKEAKECEIVKGEDIGNTNKILQSLYNNSMILNKSIGDIEFSYGKWSYYQNGTVKLLSNNGRVMNIVFLDDYPDNVLRDINTRMSLNDIYEKYPNYSFGGPSQGYLCYRTSNFYAYIYNDEISIVTYGYVDDSKLAKYIDKYYSTRNLEEFAKNIISYWKNYEEYELNLESGYLKITYPNFGLFIEIFGNKDVKIDIYSNLKIGERIAKLAGEGRVNILKDRDSVNEWEQKRRLNEATENSLEYKEYETNKKNEEATKENINSNEVEVIKIN
jgi:hypothetical protein